MGQRSFCATFIDQTISSGPLANFSATQVFTGLLLMLFSTFANANQFHDLQSLQASVSGYLQTYYADTRAEKIEINVGNLDKRLLLAQCSQPLSMKLNDPSNTGGNLTVHARCEGDTPWSVYVPAQVALFKQLPVASRNLVRGDIVTENDVLSEVVNTSLLRQGQIDDSQQIIGQEVKRPIAKGEPFRNAALDSPLVIKRGDPVQIELQTGSISVSSNGTAMANGRIGERIRVRNGQSDRIVNAQVVAAGRVLTVM